MGPTCLLIALITTAGQEPKVEGGAAAQAAARTKRERLLEIYRAEAESYAIHRDAGRTEQARLRREPVYVWTNPVRGGGQDGAVFVWTCRGRAEVLGCFFSYPATGPRHLSHEFHSLSLAVLDVRRPESGGSRWTPLAPGVTIAPIPGAPEPGRTAAERLAQMRALSHEFSASTQDDKGRRWELRLLPHPLYRYESTDPDVLDGALFAFVTSAGTDPEALLAVEARKPSGADRPVWQYGLARFTDQQLWVRLKDKEVFSAPVVLYDKPYEDVQHRYRAFRDRDIPAVEDRTP